ncbi:MAG: CO dehydrogenase/CO-methylating acetyl-CoA synthase complex subunit beta [Armatimonadota bacterium]|nr:MAG: CO dehydrogenase/CO-methylating acetyl-CoA synthase complex subunit beta [Armatimonadota bacterium]
MSKIVAAAAVRGSHGIVAEAEEKLSAAIEKHGEGQALEFPETAFFLPMAHALLGLEVKTLGEAREIVETAKGLLSEEPSEKLWLPYLPAALDAGIATLLGEELIKAIAYLEGEEPLEGWHGFISDTILRTLGIQLVDGRLPGFAAVVGAAPDTETAVHVIRELQKRNILTFLIGNHKGETMRDQLIEAGVLPKDASETEDGDLKKAWWGQYIVPLGPDTESIIYALNWAIRGALTFGGHKKGEWKQCLDYTRARIFAFGLGLGDIDDLKYASGAGAINMGFPVICDTEIPEIRPSGVCTYEELVRELDHQRIVETCVEVRGVKVTVTKIDIPVPVAAAFEGETVRRDDMHVQFGGKYSAAFEFLRMRPMEEVEDGKIEVVGPDCDSAEVGGAMPLGMVIKVAGRKMQEDFEPILERQVHTIVNHAMGVFHMGQRDMSWVRISKDAFKSGLRLRHFGELLRAEYLQKFPALVDKVQVRILTDESEIEKVLAEARPVWDARDARVAGMTDESVDIFYSCTLCQSYAPNHVCVISPERLGLCGAYNWLDGRAAYEINPAGANQPVPKGKVIDDVKGQWEGVNEFVYQTSNKSVERFNAYSLMEDPMTSCGCFECIMAILPEPTGEVHGVMIVNREYPGMTPCGMAFTTLAGTVGGGMQTPGFLGIGRLYTVSRKFISAEGGLPRVLWMPKELKEALADRIKARAEEMGLDGLYDKIADETVATTMEELMPWLEEHEHPALKMPSLM